MSWAELLDFFFLKDTVRGNSWWNKLDNEGKIRQPKQEKVYSKLSKDDDSDNSTGADPLERRREKLLQ
jgi:hypothetical protein